MSRTRSRVDDNQLLILPRGDRATGGPMRRHSSLNISKGDRVRLRGLAGTFVVSQCWGRMLDATNASGQTELTSTWAITMVLPRAQKGVRTAASFFEQGHQ